MDNHPGGDANNIDKNIENEENRDNPADKQAETQDMETNDQPSEETPAEPIDQGEANEETSEEEPNTAEPDEEADVEEVAAEAAADDETEDEPDEEISEEEEEPVREPEEAIEHAPEMEEIAEAESSEQPTEDETEEEDTKDEAEDEQPDEDVPIEEAELPDEDELAEDDAEQPAEEDIPGETEQLAEVHISAGEAVLEAIAPAEDADAQDEVIALPKPEYSMRGFGMVCITSELVWFFGSKWALSLISSFGLNAVSAQYIVAVLWFPLTMFIIPNIYMRLNKLNTEQFVGLRGRFSKMDMAIVALAAFAIWALMRLPEIYWGRLITRIFDGNIPRISGIGAYDTIFIIDFIRKCIIPAFFEEYLYRGVLFRSLRGGIGARRAAALSSLIFMLMHTDLTNVVAPIALGLLCCYLLETTGSIYPCMLSHFIYNTSSTIGNMSVSSRELSGSLGAGVPVMALMLISCTVLLGMCMYMVRKGGRFDQSVSVEEYAVCKRKKFDLLPYYLICIFLVAGYFV